MRAGYVGCGAEPDIRTQREELLRRVEAHPVRSWPPSLVAAFSAMIDSVFGPPCPEKPTLKVVRSATRPKPELPHRQDIPPPTVGL